MTRSMTEKHDIAALLDIMRALRDPDTGCPWDREQDFVSIAPYTVEEAYEVAGAIEEKDWSALKEELGDLLLQVVYHARMAEERRLFDFGDVVSAICEKMVRRHPHVFASAAAGGAAQAQTLAWEEHKKGERAAKLVKGHGLVDDVPRALPALMRAVKLQKRLSSVGFDWNSADRVLEKVAEEAKEIVEARNAGAPPAKIEDEVGDLLFVIVNLARHLKIDPEQALSGTNEKVIRRFRFIEKELAATGRSPADASLDEMEALWQAAKKIER